MSVDKTDVSLELWDTAGQEDYERTRPMTYPDTNVFIICFSLVCPTNLENVKNKWKSEIRSFCPKAEIILCGTKADLRDSWDSLSNKDPGCAPISQKDAMQAAKEIGAREYVECSALKAVGIKEVFETAALAALKPQTNEPKPKRKCNLL